MRHVRMMALASVTALAGGCGGGRPDPDPTGEYVVEGRWDVSSPIGGERTVGVVASELVVDELASAAPSALQDQAREALEATLGDAVQSYVDERVPPELAPDSDLMRGLGMLTGRVHFASDLSLVATGKKKVEGTERFERLWVVHDGTTYEAPLDLVLEEAPDAISVAADWKGKAAGPSMDVEVHPVQIRFGMLVAWLAEGVLGADVAALEEQTLGALYCPALAERVTDGSGELTLDLGVDTVSLDFTAGCNSALEALGARALGMFVLDTPLELGGDVNLIDADGDGMVDELQSGSEHGGVLLLSRAALSPPVEASFVGRAR